MKKKKIIICIGICILIVGIILTISGNETNKIEKKSKMKYQEKIETNLEEPEEIIKEEEKLKLKEDEIMENLVGLSFEGREPELNGKYVTYTFGDEYMLIVFWEDSADGIDMKTGEQITTFNLDAELDEITFYFPNGDKMKRSFNMISKDEIKIGKIIFTKTDKQTWADN